MNYATYGPYEIKEWTREGMTELFSDVDEANPGLSSAVGVYIVATKDKSGVLVPWYVGKTVNGFGKRFYQHLNGDRFRKLFSKNSSTVRVFLIPRVTSGAKFKKATKKLKEKGLRSTNLLEFALIGACLVKNNDLMNSKEVTLHKLFHVPGFWNSSPKNYDGAARQLARMLGTKLGV